MAVDEVFQSTSSAKQRLLNDIDYVLGCVDV